MRSRPISAAADITAQVRIMIADDEPVVREALAQLIGSEPGLELVGIGGDSDEAVALAERLQPDVALVDVRMPGGGAAATRGIRDRSPHTKVIALSAHGDRATVLEMIRSGASGYLVKGAPGREVLDTIMLCARGESRLSAEVTGDIVSELSEHLQRAATAKETRRSQVQRIQDVLDGRDLTIVVQPIVELETGEIVGFEALSRFPAPEIAPAPWFEDAETVGMRGALELHAAIAAFDCLEALPAHSFLSVNVSPATLQLDPCEQLTEAGYARVVLELTEHARVDDYEDLARMLGNPRTLGARIAIDDVGAGFASLRHILNVAPEFIKLDGSLTRNVHHDLGRRGLARAMITFAGELDATIVAEGIETAEQLETLRSLGVRYGQGFYLGRPGPP